MNFSNKKFKRFTFRSEDRKSLLNENAPFYYREAFKALRTNLNFTSFGGELKTIVITSSIPNEGKTSVTLNLAQTLAEVGKKVVVVDADLRNPSVHQYLKIKRNTTAGLTGYLSGTAIYHSVVCSIPGVNLDVVPAGTIPPNPAELLSHPRFKELIELLKDNYDYVLIDTSPSTLVTDASIVSRSVDGVILVVRHKFASKDVVKSAKNRIETVGGNLLGVVMNYYDATKNASTSAYDYSYDYYGSNE